MASQAAPPAPGADAARKVSHITQVLRGVVGGTLPSPPDLGEVSTEDLPAVLFEHILICVQSLPPGGTHQLLFEHCADAIGYLHQDFPALTAHYVAETAQKWITLCAAASAAGRRRGGPRGPLPQQRGVVVPRAAGFVLQLLVELGGPRCWRAQGRSELVIPLEVKEKLWLALRNVARQYDTPAPARAAALHAMLKVFGPRRISATACFLAGEDGLCWDADQEVRKYVLECIDELWGAAAERLAAEQRLPAEQRHAEQQLQGAQERMRTAVMCIALQDPVPALRRAAGSFIFKMQGAGEGGGRGAAALDADLTTVLVHASHDRDRQVRANCFRMMAELDPEALAEALAGRAVLGETVLVAQMEPETKGLGERIFAAIVRTGDAVRVLRQAGYNRQGLPFEGLLRNELRKLP
eukprot:TRINITY_DN12369_c0_g1_i1.p2 TRINITY_DN12369_c0_g1~~TRINITY_DN12369_c0_g1_i1.p2  ORF type:complete len:437 (+),score=154.09 TRINITY_DN12369_c0_g1_i1:81-1313(+)